MAEVFISYSRTDSTFVRALDEHLKGQGRDVWVDWEDIAPADDWQQNIYDNIDAAESFVFVVSAKSLGSQYCGKELARAQEGGKRIIPIACDAADPAAAPASLAQLNWIWCRSADDRGTAFEKLTSALETDLGWSKAHTRLLVRAVEWDARGDSSLLLRGADLREAEQNLAANVGKQPEPTELQQRYLLASRRAATRRQRIMLGSAGVALAVSIGLGILALLQRNDARAATQSAGANAAAASASNPETPPDLSLLLGYAAYRVKPQLAERSGVLTALEAARESGVVRIFRGHTNSVLSVAYSPDGHMLASAGADGTVRLWDVDGSSQPVVLHGGAGAVDTVAFDRGGSVLASGGGDGTIRLWDVHTGRQLGVLRGHVRSVKAVAFSPDHRTLASAGADGTIRFWDVQSHRQVRVIHVDEGSINGIAFSPDGRMLASAASGPHHGAGVVRLWDVGSGRPVGLRMRQENGYQALGVAFSPDGRTVASAGADGDVRLWRVPSGRLVVAQYESRTAMHSVAFSPDGRTLASSSADGSIWLLKAGTLETARMLTGQRGDVYSVAFGPNGRLLASAGADRTLRAWNLRGQPTLAQGGTVTGLAFGTGAHTLIVAGTGRGQAPRFWNLRTLHPGGRLDRATGGVDSIAVSRRGRLLATGGNRGTIRLWDLRGRFRGQLQSGSEEVRGLAFSPDGKLLASANADDTIQTWNVRTLKKTGKPLHGATGWDYVTNSVAFSPDGRTLASGGDDYTVRLWNVRTRGQIGRLRGDTSWMAAVAFSSDGKTLASADWDGTVRLWNVHTHREIGDPLRGHTGPVEALAFSPDGSTLASGGDDSTVRLWDVRSRRQLGQPLRAGRSNSVVDVVAFSPNGHSLASGNDHGMVRIWRGILWRDLTGLRTQVCNLVVGNLTRAEVQEFAPGLPYVRACSG